MPTSLTVGLLVAVLLFAGVDSAPPAALAPASRQANGDWEWFPSYIEHRCSKRPKLVAYLQPTNGNTVSGMVSFGPAAMKGRCAVSVTATVTGLAPGTKHGFHVHQYGDLGPNAEGINNGSQVGGHYTTVKDRKHGLPTEKGARHEGDLGNLVADSSGTADFKLVVDNVALEQLLGRGVVVHADEDKGVIAQPVGGSGKRIATGVIGYAFVPPPPSRR
jgi:superoxide dismutase, Cu-Zn family